jgi:thiol-disulfide isomerase/thioredoxin
MMRARLAALAGLVVAAAGSSAFALDIGDKAPALDIKEWAQGEPVTLDGKNVYVVEFWATWCGPCKRSIPHLCELADKYRGKGVEFIGVSNEKPDTVKEFVKTTKFTYHVACDDDNKTNGSYMEGVDGIPHAFIVDKNGIVAWQGNPLSDGIDAAVEQIVSGKFDVAKAKAVADLKKGLERAIESNDVVRIGDAADKVLETAPTDEMALDVRFKVFENQRDAAGCKEFVEKLLPRINDDASALNSVAWKLATLADLSMRQPAAALKAAKRSVEISHGKDAATLDTLARVYYETGMLDEALATQTKAAAIEGADPSIKQTLAYYKTCAELKKAATEKK